MRIEDGTGSGKLVKVDMNNRLLVSSEINLKSSFISKDTGRCYNTVSVDASAAAGDYICYLKNTSTTLKLYVDIVRVSSVNAALWKVTTVTGTAAGSTALTPANVNLGSGIVADATARGDGAISGLTADTLIATVRSPAASSVNIPFDDTLILGANDAIAIEYDTGSTGAAEVLIRAYYDL